MMKNVLVLADSISLVRPDDAIEEKDLYTYKIQHVLKEKLYLISKARKNNTSEIESTQEAFIYHHKAANCHYAIIFLGIVDCAPRTFSKTTKKVLNCMSQFIILKKVAGLYIKLKSSERYQRTKKHQLTEVSKEDYNQNMLKIIHNLKQNNPIEHIFFINILTPGKVMTTRSFGIEKNVLDYNQVIDNLCSAEQVTLIDLYSFTKENPQFVLDDGHHITKEAHDFIANKIITVLNAKESI